MSAFVTLDCLSLATPDGRALFSDLTLAFGRERTGIVGRNGSGKSTLVRVMAGELAAVSGSVTRNFSVGLLHQDWADSTISLAQALGVDAALARLRKIEKGNGDETDFAEADWTLDERLEEVLAEVGLPGIGLSRAIDSLSGGERTRIAIARVLLAAPDLLLLDEPTNNLDADGRAAIARLVARWPGGVVVASHDRALLEGMDRIVELTPLGCTLTGGGWSAFAVARDARREAVAADLERAEAVMRATTRAVQQQAEKKARRDKAGRAFADSGSAPKIVLGMMKERAENSGARDKQRAARQIAEAEDTRASARAQVERLTPLRIALPPGGAASSRVLLRFQDVTWQRGGTTIGPLDFTLRGSERVALAGPNGSGKTSVLTLAAGLAEPSVGQVTRAGRIVLLDQHVSLLDRDATILANLRARNPALDDNAAHAALARFGFRNIAAERIVGTLSGGERLRAGLACALSAAEPPQLLLLDEPTNHLDIDSIEVLEAALASYDGALLVASHDPAFLEEIGIEREMALG